MKTENKQVGNVGERAAADYLLKKGYELLKSNYGTQYGEIDLIMKDKDLIVFVEVKSKTSTLFGTPEDMFDRRKYNQVKRMATMYLLGAEVPCRIDMVAVEIRHGLVNEIRHYENVVY